MKKFLKCLYICAAAFLCFSCSNLMNNGSATLILDFSGESPERYISSNNTGDIECSSLDMHGDTAFFEIKLQGPVTRKYRFDYIGCDTNGNHVERLVMDGLVPGRYKMYVQLGNEFFDCIYYGEQKIFISAGSNYRQFNIYKLVLSSIKSITGAKFIMKYQEGFNPFLNNNRVSTLIGDNDTLKFEGAYVTYNGGYSEVFSAGEADYFKSDARFVDNLDYFDYSVYLNGTLLGKKSDMEQTLVDLDYTKNGYYIIFKFTGFNGSAGFPEFIEGFTLRADIEFEPM